MASKPGGGSRPKCRPSCCVTTTLANPKRLRLLTSMLSRPTPVRWPPPRRWGASVRRAASFWSPVQRTCQGQGMHFPHGGGGRGACLPLPVADSAGLVQQRHHALGQPSGARPRNGMTKAASSPIQGSSTAPKALTCSTVHARSLRWWVIRNVSGSGSSAGLTTPHRFGPIDEQAPPTRTVGRRLFAPQRRPLVLARARLARPRFWSSAMMKR